jgi:thiamine-phosphate pyrophosphorylase
LKKISRLQFITTNAALAEKACLGGVKWIQLRLKNTPQDEFLTVAKEVQQVCKAHNAVLIINDNVEVAYTIKADGVHLGKEDLPPLEARKVLGAEAIIGGSSHTRTDIVRLASQGVDYIGLGPFRYTATKEKLASVIGKLGYKRIVDYLAAKKVVYPPIVAIGGIGIDDVQTLLKTGVYGIAVSGAIANSANVTNTSRIFTNMLRLD